MRDEFIIDHRGKQYALFAGLLDEAHGRGLAGIDTDLLQVPDDGNGNVAICKAVVDMGDGKTFSGIGDASPDNVGRGIAPHIIRMAETRAKARALRDAINAGVTAFEEIVDEEKDGPAAERQPRQPQAARSGHAGGERAPAPAAGRGAARGAPGAGGGKRPNRSAQQGNAPANEFQVKWLKEHGARVYGSVGALVEALGKPVEELTVAEGKSWAEDISRTEREMANG